MIERDRVLFENLVDVAESMYTSGMGKTRQRDLVRAQLELSQLDERLSVLRQQRDVARAQLNKWLTLAETQQPIDTRLPLLQFDKVEGVAVVDAGDAQINAALLAHPIIRSLDQQLIASETAIDLAQQQYRPQWAVKAGYGYRDDDPIGADRSDFFSLALSVDLPLFVSSRQDQQLRAAVSTSAALKADKALALRALKAEFVAAKARWQRLGDRQKLYEDRLLLQIHDQAEASLTAYTNDDGDFTEVVRAHIGELNAHVDLLNIRVDRLKTLAQLNYFVCALAAAYSEGDSL